MTSNAWEEFNIALQKARHVRLMLDYDGTLEDFTASPDIVPQDPALIALLQRLAAGGKYLLAVVSGRSLTALSVMLPFNGIILAGTYGLEMRLPDGTVTNGADFAQVRPVMDKVKPLWQQLLSGEHGFYLEDKAWSLALHAKLASALDAARVMDSAYRELMTLLPLPGFKIEHRERFLEIYPEAASKRLAIERIMTRYTPAGALPVFAGDDTHDENAFSAVQEAGGYCIRVASDSVPTRAQFRIETPAQMRLWLAHLADHSL